MTVKHAKNNVRVWGSSSRDKEKGKNAKQLQGVLLLKACKVYGYLAQLLLQCLV